MVVLRGRVILGGFGFRGFMAMRLRPSRHGLNARSQALRDAARRSALRRSCASGDCESALGKSNDSEGAQASSRLQKSVRDTLPAYVEESREANQAHGG